MSTDTAITTMIDTIPGLTTCYTPGNPYWRRIADRLREQGGKHKASTVQDDRLQMREELACEMKREAVSLRDRPINPF